MKKIAILGATSHIAKGLILTFVPNNTVALNLYDRDEKKVKQYLKQNGLEEKVSSVNNLHKFSSGKHDCVINCIGAGTPEKIKELAGAIFFLAEKYDNLIIEYLKQNSKTLYINFSSGIVYGPKGPFSQKSVFCFEPNQGMSEYQMAKLYSEAKHRSLNNLNIVDLRIFSYFSRFIDLESSFLLCEILRAALDHKTFVTSPEDIFRDFIDMEDLSALILLCLEQRKINCAFDTYSKKPVSKFDLLKYFAKHYGLKYRVSEGKVKSNSTGYKNAYYSLDRSAKNLGYSAKFSAIESVAKEAQIILQKI